MIVIIDKKNKYSVVIINILIFILYFTLSLIIIPTFHFVTNSTNKKREIQTFVTRNEYRLDICNINSRLFECVYGVIMHLWLHAWHVRIFFSPFVVVFTSYIFWLGPGASRFNNVIITKSHSKNIYSFNLQILLKKKKK